MIGDGPRRLIERCLPPEQQAALLRLLDEDCAERLPGLDPSRAELIERVQLAVLRAAALDADAVPPLVRLAQQDWRDVLVLAGFAMDAEAHRRWLAQVLDARCE